MLWVLPGTPGTAMMRNKSPGLFRTQKKRGRSPLVSLSLNASTPLPQEGLYLSRHGLRAGRAAQDVQRGLRGELLRVACAEVEAGPLRPLGEAVELLI